MAFLATYPSPDQIAAHSLNMQALQNQVNRETADSTKERCIHTLNTYFSTRRQGIALRLPQGHISDYIAIYNIEWTNEHVTQFHLDGSLPRRSLLDISEHEYRAESRPVWIVEQSCHVDGPPAQIIFEQRGCDFPAGKGLFLFNLEGEVVKVVAAEDIDFGATKITFVLKPEYTAEYGAAGWVVGGDGSGSGSEPGSGSSGDEAGGFVEEESVVDVESVE